MPLGDVVTQGLFLFHSTVVMAVYKNVEDNMVINELIRRLMMEKKKTIKDIADATGYPVPRISDIVLNDSSVTTKEGDRIFDALGVNLRDVIRY